VAITDLLAHGVSHIWFTGGEPTLRQELPDLVRFSLAVGAERVVVVTNGVTLSEARARTYAGLCRSYARFALHVSIDGATAETHDALRGPGAWGRTMAGISRLRSHGGSVAVVQSVLTSRSATELQEYPRLLDAVGARGLHVFSLASVGRAASLDETLPSAQWPAVLAMLEQLRWRGFKVSVQGPIVGEDFDGANPLIPRAGGTTTPTVVVGPDGEMLPCPFLRHVPIGNITERADLPSAVARLGAVTDRACQNCRYLTVCAGLDLHRPFRTQDAIPTHPHDHFPLTTAVRVALR
jgi:radical SAM protein with 4Fe4S-binding SPASM domain